jgi:hypothetical protein
VHSLLSTRGRLVQKSLISRLLNKTHASRFSAIPVASSGRFFLCRSTHLILIVNVLVVPLLQRRGFVFSQYTILLAAGTKHPVFRGRPSRRGAGRAVRL